MRRLILIFGDLASGKSTFADILSKRTGIPAIKKDRIKEILADTVGFETREENVVPFPNGNFLTNKVYYNNSVDGRDLEEEKGRLPPSLFAFGNNERKSRLLSDYFLLWSPRM